MTQRGCLRSAAASLLLCLAPSVRGQPRLTQGVSLTVTVGAQSDTRRARLVALAVERGACATPFVASGAFHAEWRGAIRVPLRDRYEFGFEGNGTFEFEVRGEIVLRVADGTPTEWCKKRVRLRKGDNAFVARYRSPAHGNARVRLLWKGYEIPREPVPPGVLFHDATRGELVLGERRRRGRALVMQHRCMACHVADAAESFLRPAPSLAGVAARLSPGWMRQWLVDPRALRPSARMPRLVHGKDAAQQAADLVAFLVGTRKGPAAKARSAGDAERGGQTFAKLGCIGCHTRPDVAVEPASRERIPLAMVGAKFVSEAVLAEFLEAPQRHYAWIRMPDFALSSAEASDLAAFLFERGKSLATTPFLMGDQARGRTLYADKRCGRCHEPQTSKAPPAKPWNDVQASLQRRGCAVTPATSGVAYPLDERERAAVAAFGATTGWQADALAEAAEAQIHELRCIACHRLDGVEERWRVLASETKDIAAPAPKREISQRRPTLTWFGEKLQTPWIEAFLSGRIDISPRPWLRARMPRFRSRAALLARGLAAMQGLSGAPEIRAKPDLQLVAIGRRLVGRRGFSCNLCHAIGAAPPVEVFEAQGVNFAYVSERLRRDFFRRWLMNPQRIEPGTRMPTIADEDGLTDYHEILDGSAERQFGAIWNYLSLGRALPPVDERER